MNEICAIVTYVVFSEKLACDSNSYEEAISKNLEETMRFINSEKYVKHDIYSIFNKIMNSGIKELFLQDSISDSMEERHI